MLSVWISFFFPSCVELILLALKVYVLESSWMHACAYICRITSPVACNGWGWAKLKLGARKPSPGLPNGWQRCRYLTQTAASQGTRYRKVDLRAELGLECRHFHRDVSIPSSILTTRSKACPCFDRNKRLSWFIKRQIVQNILLILCYFDVSLS